MLLAILGVVGCGIIGVNCDDDFRAGIVMTVVDFISGGPVPGEATATAPDYQTWMTTGVTVQVSGTSCSVTRVRLTALLQLEEEGT